MKCLCEHDEVVAAREINELTPRITVTVKVSVRVRVRVRVRISLRV